MKDSNTSDRVEIISAAAYFANPQAASVQAERVGRVVVQDASGNTRLVINSNRVTEVLLDK